MSFAIRKLQQIDNFRELPKEKQPTDKMIWDGTSEELDKWFDDIFSGRTEKNSEFVIEEDDIG